MTMTARPCALTCLMLLACSSPTSPPPTSAPAPAAHSAGPRAGETAAAALPDTSSTAVASPSPTGVVAAAPLPLPPRPDEVDEQTFEVLANICAVATVRDASGKLHIGCRSSPPFDKPEARPDGKLRQLDDPMQFYEVCTLDGIYRGSFSGVGRDEAVIGLAACGAERVNDITPGKVVLAEREGTGWRVSQVIDDVNVSSCRPSPRNDRTLLVCKDNMGAFNDGHLVWRATIDFAAAKTEREGVFGKIFSTAAASCADHVVALLAETGITVVEEVDATMRDTDGDGYEDLVVTVDRGQVNGSDVLRKRAEALCKQPVHREGGLPLAQLVGKKSRHRLLFKGTPKGLTPNASTKKLLDQWGSQAPEFWWNVK